MANTTKEWSMNDTQKAFIEDLKSIGHPASLKEIEARTGHKYATGSVNVLSTKGKVKAEKSSVPYVEKITFDFDGCTVVTETNKSKELTLYSVAE